MRRRLLGGLPPEVGALAGVAFCVALGFGILAPALPVFARSFGVSAFAATTVISVFALMRLVSSPGAGWLVNTLGERSVLATGLGIVALSSLLAGFAQSFAWLLVLRGAGGIGSAMFTVSAFALLLRVVAPEQRGRAAGTFQAGFLFGGIAGPALGGLVVGWSLRAPFFVYAATLVAAVAVTLVMLTHTQLRDDTGVAEQSAEATGLRAALRDRAYRAALAVNFGNGMVSFGLRTALVPLFVVESLRSGPSLAGAGFLLGAAAQAVLLVPAGRSADHRGRRPVMIGGSILLLAGMLTLSLSSGPVVFLLAMLVLGGSAACLGSAPAAVVGDVVGGRRRGVAIAAYQMASDVGTIVGPLVAGLLADSVGYGWAFFAGAVVAVVTVALTTTMPETLRRTPPTPVPASG